MDNKFYGPSTGETGQYGVGDIVEGTTITTDPDGGYLLDGEPVYNIFIVKNGTVEYIELN